MTEEVNAAIDGALDGGATSIVVSDGHSDGRNILIEKLHAPARLNSGSPAPLSMVQGAYPRRSRLLHWLSRTGQHTRGHSVSHLDRSGTACLVESAGSRRDWLECRSVRIVRSPGRAGHGRSGCGAGSDLIYLARSKRWWSRRPAGAWRPSVNRSRKCASPSGIRRRMRWCARFNPISSLRRLRSVWNSLVPIRSIAPCAFPAHSAWMVSPSNGAATIWSACIMPSAPSLAWVGSLSTDFRSLQKSKKTGECQTRPSRLGLTVIDRFRHRHRRAPIETRRQRDDKLLQLSMVAIEHHAQQHPARHHPDNKARR